MHDIRLVCLLLIRKFQKKRQETPQKCRIEILIHSTKQTIAQCDTCKNVGCREYEYKIIL